MRKHVLAVAISSILALALSACGGSNNSPAPVVTPAPVPVPNTATASGFTLSVFAKAPSANQKPDSVEKYNDTVFIAYQNGGEVKDGSVPTVTNAVVQYDLSGNILKTYTVPGHVDGLMARTDTNTLWAMANEDRNPELTIIDLVSGSQKTYQATVNPTAHGGGYDDMQLLNGVVYASASAPTTPGVGPTVVTVALNTNGKTFDVAPVLAGTATATDITPSVGGSPNPTFNQPVALNLTDPDSETIDPLGNLVLDSQADSKLVFIKNPGVNQTVSVLSLTLRNDKDGAAQSVDDTRFVPAAGKTGKTFLLFTDSSNTTYRVDASFKQGDAYSAGLGQVMQADLKTGHLTPVVTGIGVATALGFPHGMLFVAQ